MNDTISLSKGEKISLDKEAPGLKNIAIGLGWDVNASNGAAFDLDASVLMLNASGKLVSEKNFVYFKNLTSPCGSVSHSGDNLTGVGDGDDETISAILDKIPSDVDQLVVAVNIYDAQNRKQNFGQVKNAFARIYNKDTNAEIKRYDLSEDFSTETVVVFCRLYRHNGEWKFEATGTGKNIPFTDFVASYQ